MTAAEVGETSGARAVVVVIASALLGGLTFGAQGLLPFELQSFANSASGWTLLTAALVAWSRAGTTVPAAALGGASFVLLVVGYTVAAFLVGLTYSPVLFGLIGVVVGPFVGVAASWLRSVMSWRAAAGTGLLAGIGVGESIYGLTVVAATTSAVYWVLIGIVAVALLVGMSVRRISGARQILGAVLGTVAVAAVFVVAHQGVGLIGA